LHYYAFYKGNNNINIIKVSSDVYLGEPRKGKLKGLLRGLRGLRVIKVTRGLRGDRGFMTKNPESYVV
jgi:hypothetical protein